MAKIIEKDIAIKLSKITKNENDDTISIPDDVLATLEEVLQQIVGANVVVEIYAA